MKADLISRESAIDAVKHAWAKGLEPSQYIEIIPSVPAVPLDKLCEWLQYNHVIAPCDNDCENCVAYDGTGNIAECRKMVLTKWMEEQDADNI